MKKFFIILAILFMVSSMNAKGIKKPFVEISPRTSLYIDGETTFGLGCDVVDTGLGHGTSDSVITTTAAVALTPLAILGDCQSSKTRQPIGEEISPLAKELKGWREEDRLYEITREKHKMSQIEYKKLSAIEDWGSEEYKVQCKKWNECNKGWRIASDEWCEYVKAH